MYNMFYNTIYTRYCFKIKFSYEIKIAYVCVMLIPCNVYPVGVL